MFHVFARGNAGDAIYRDDLDRLRYLDLLARVVGRKGWLCLGYCLMHNHVHLLLETPQPNLGRGMQLLHGRYAEGFNARHARPGHVFQGRFGSVHIARDEHLLAAAAYVALNPVAAGLCERPEDWRWGSHAALLERRPPRWLAVRRLLALFAGSGSRARERYRAYIAERLPGTCS